MAQVSYLFCNAIPWLCNSTQLRVLVDMHRCSTEKQSLSPDIAHQLSMKYARLSKTVTKHALNAYAHDT